MLPEPCDRDIQAGFWRRWASAGDNENAWLCPAGLVERGEGHEMPTGGVAALSAKSGPFAGGMLLTR